MHLWWSITPLFENKPGERRTFLPVSVAFVCKYRYQSLDFMNGNWQLWAHHILVNIYLPMSCCMNYKTAASFSSNLSHHMSRLNNTVHMDCSKALDAARRVLGVENSFKKMPWMLYPKKKAMDGSICSKILFNHTTNLHIVISSWHVPNIH